jgi:two-component system, chemotaxis family, sensor kinase CheA
VARTAIDIEGARAQAVVGADILALAGHELGPLPEVRCRLLRLSDGDSEIAYIVREVVDAGAMTGELTPVPDDPAIEGVTLIAEELVPVVDCHRLFAAGNSRPRAANPPVCRVPQGDEWSRTILEPLLRAAGYAVTDRTDEEADVAIWLADDGSPPAPAKATIRLSPDRDDDSGAIYRYDREALLGALRDATRRRAK